MEADLENSLTNSARTFYHDYPNNPYINAQYIARNKLFQSRYKIIELGYYPQNVKYTQKGKNIQYQIPNKYIIKTEVANQT
ncbi:1096_t:CDS:2, partial [Dentiscutata heterogama]